MPKEPQTSLFEMTMSLSNAVDLVSPLVANHHKQVAYIAFCLGEAAGFPPEQRNTAAVAGSLHDIGLISLKHRQASMRFDFDLRQETTLAQEHAETGYLALKSFRPLLNAARVIRHHHLFWNEGRGMEFRSEAVPYESHLLHLADRIAVLVKKEEANCLAQQKSIYRKLQEHSGTLFDPRLLDAFRQLVEKESFWFDLTSGSLGSILANKIGASSLKLDLTNLLKIAEIFAHVIDFRSRFTTTHSSGVSTTAEFLAKKVGFSAQECQAIRVAGFLHDLGKLAIPPEILEKPGPLSPQERATIRKHSYYTFRILEPIAAFETINAWAAFHHETLDGGGYPFHFTGDRLPLGSRILAIADVFTALTENRPYRKGMDREATLQVLNRMAEHSKLDPNLVPLLKEDFEEVDAIRRKKQLAMLESSQEILLHFSPPK